MRLLGLDVGSSSVKAAILEQAQGGPRFLTPIARAAFPTHFEDQRDGARAEVNPQILLRAISRAATDLGSISRSVDFVALSVMSPAWVAMDRSGKPLTAIITHQDRRSIDVARRLARELGRDALRIAGNLPFPGGISCTTAAWFAEHHPALFRRADLIGHLNTFLLRQFTGQRAIDLSNASFTGLFETLKLGAWSPRLCKAAGVKLNQLPEIFPANRIVGPILPAAARMLHVPVGTPMLCGLIDTSAAMLATGAAVGQLLNVSGSTDVLGLCTDRPRPHECLLTRALGVGKLWMSVGTLAAAGSSLDWIRREMFRDLLEAKFFSHLNRLLRGKQTTAVRFDPYLAGERVSIEQKTAAFSNLTLATTRDDLLLGVANGLAAASAARLDLLHSRGTPIRPRVVVSGGAARALRDILYRDWPARYTFIQQEELTLRGLAMLHPEIA